LCDLSEQTAIISLYSINWLVFITDSVIVYCAVRAGSLYIIQIPLKPSGYYMYHQFNIHKSHVLPTQFIYVFVWLSEHTEIISLYSINWLVFITYSVIVYCAVQAGSLYILQIPLKPSGHCMYHQFNIHQFYVLPTQCIYVFCVDLRSNRDYFHLQH